MNSKPTAEDIEAIRENFTAAGDWAQKTMEEALKDFDALETYLNRKAAETDEQDHLVIPNPDLHAHWVHETLKTLAQVRDAAEQDIRKLVLYAIDEGIPLKHLAESANIGVATVHRWRDVGTYSPGISPEEVEADRANGRE